MTLPFFADCLLQTAVAFVATVAFSSIFHAPKNQYIPAGLTGAFGWLIYTVVMHFQPQSTFASFFAALGLTYLARIFAFHRRCPVTVFLISGIFPIVPGAGIYYTGYRFFMNSNSAGAEMGLETIKIAIAIALGIGIVVSLPRGCFTRRPKLEGRDVK